MNFVPFAARGALVLLAAPLMACASNVPLGSAKHLAGHRKVAVTDVGVRVYKHRNWLTRSPVLEAVPFPNALIENHTVDALQRGLLASGFTPIERRRVKAILGEQARHRSGLYTNTARVGRLTGAQALFTGTVFIKTDYDLTYTIAETVIFPPMLLYRMVKPNTVSVLTFHGRLVSVEDGTILLSGETSITRRGFALDHISQVVDQWFQQVHEI